MPGAKFAGTSTEMVGFQLAELTPVPAPVTIVRFSGGGRA